MRNFTLYWVLAKEDLVRRYSGSSLGIGWIILSTLATVIIYAVIFGGVMGAQLPGTQKTHAYTVYLVSGLLPWLLFNGVIIRTCGLFVEKKPLLSKVSLSLARLPLIVILSELMIFGLSMATFLVLAWVFYGELRPAALFLLPVATLTIVILAYAVGLLLATLFVFIRDIKEVVGIALQFLFWLCPIVYVPSILPRLAAEALVFNPLTPIIGIFRAAVLDVPIPYTSFSIVSAASAGLAIASWYFLRKLEKEVRDFI